MNGLNGLKKRYGENPTEKNRVAYLNAKDRFSENIGEREKEDNDFGFNKIEINTCKYKLIEKLPLKDDNVEYGFETEFL